jgi:two-component system, OmpR family, sensor histidine kinase TctE
MKIPGLSPSGSIRQRLILQLLVLVAVLSWMLYISVRTVASSAVETTQDAILGSATIAIAEELRGGDDGVGIDIPYTAFSMLGATGEDRVFYRIVIDGVTVTGYDDLPLSDDPLGGLTPIFYTRAYQSETVRIAAVERSVLVSNRPVRVVVAVAQTRSAQDAIVARMANRAAALGIGFFAVAALLSLLTARSVIQPVRNVAEAVRRRGPQDLRPVDRPVPSELAPLVTALNQFIARLSGALFRTETFIAEAAHHIRTPLATLRAQAEIALRQSHDEAARAAIRGMIRSVDDSARSVGQLLDHAAVVYRTDQRADEEIDLAALTRDVVAAFGPAAELREISFDLSVPDQPVTMTADRLLLESAIRNLLDNAVKYSALEGLISVSLLVEGGEARLSVRDRGRGLSGVRSAALTGRFRRGTNVADVIGSGLGLTIVREVATAHGGEFRLTEREGGGACADLSLPLA